jgi:hypothetical protein
MNGARPWSHVKRMRCASVTVQHKGHCHPMPRYVAERGETQRLATLATDHDAVPFSFKHSASRPRLLMQCVFATPLAERRRVVRVADTVAKLRCGASGRVPE